MTKEIKKAISIRTSLISDLSKLLKVEDVCFENDRLSRRSFKHHIQSPDSLLLVAETDTEDPQVVGYILCLLHRGTRLSRLYSLAVHPEKRGEAIGEKLLNKAEELTAKRGRLSMRLEVAKSNKAAIALYERAGYRKFGEYHDYYEDHQDALRMQKNIRRASEDVLLGSALWYQQTTDFTCGPASLLMAMSGFQSSLKMDQIEELKIWRESTTIFMTSGLGGTHPFGLALAAHRRGFSAAVYLNTSEPLFHEGVRVEKKKVVMKNVHEDFLSECQRKKISLNYQDITQDDVSKWLASQKAVIMLISTYRLDGRKAPHWVLITGIDEDCLYVHDPDVEEQWQQAIDCQHVPIARRDFEKMSAFGGGRLRCAIILDKAAIK